MNILVRENSSSERKRRAVRLSHHHMASLSLGPNHPPDLHDPTKLSAAPRRPEIDSDKVNFFKNAQFLSFLSFLTCSTIVWPNLYLVLLRSSLWISIFAWSSSCIVLFVLTEAFPGKFAGDLRGCVGSLMLEKFLEVDLEFLPICRERIWFFFFSFYGFL